MIQINSYIYLENLIDLGCAHINITTATDLITLALLLYPRSRKSTSREVRSLEPAYLSSFCSRYPVLSTLGHRGVCMFVSVLVSVFVCTSIYMHVFCLNRYIYWALLFLFKDIIIRSQHQLVNHFKGMVCFFAWTNLPVLGLLLGAIMCCSELSVLAHWWRHSEYHNTHKAAYFQGEYKLLKVNIEGFLLRVRPNKASFQE